VALELFSRQGYDATSLREIADRLGFTKAALYYHYQSKDEILAALVAPMGDVMREMVARLEAADGPEGWAEALGWVVGQYFEHREFFALVERNQPALVAATGEMIGDHAHIRERIEDAVRARGDFRQQVRMIAALAAVTAFDNWAPRLLADAEPAALEAELAAVTRDILGLPRRPARRRSA
jgi:AcrR family transcriptional regulator